MTQVANPESFPCNFSIARLPQIEFGSGALRRVPELVARYGRRVLIVTGSGALERTRHWQTLLDGLSSRGLDWSQQRVIGEPSPQLVDDAVTRHGQGGIDVVLGIGGGSPLDAGKAIAALLRPGTSVLDHLEGIGPERPYLGPAVPFIAVPTTAGTGSEATKNAVLSTRGGAGFKKSFRHELLIPVYAVVDPDLLASCPKPQIAANAMDALTQLLESYTSLRANPITDALAESGMRAVREGLFDWFEETAQASQGRARLAYAALVSGICLAQTGLGAVHGLASPLGAYFPIPHGVVCGTLAATATSVNLQALRERDPGSSALARYARAGEIIAGSCSTESPAACSALVDALHGWTERLGIPRLREYGISRSDFPRIVGGARGSSMKTNPIDLSDDELTSILSDRL